MPFVRSASSTAQAWGVMRSLSPEITSTGQATFSHSARSSCWTVSGSPSWFAASTVRMSVSGVGLQAPLRAVLDLLGGVRLGQRRRPEELEEAPVVPLPVVAVVLGPSLVGVEDVVEAVAGALDERGPERGGGRDEDGARDSFRVTGRHDERPVGAEGERHEHRLVDADRVHHRHRVVGELDG